MRLPLRRGGLRAGIFTDDGIQEPVPPMVYPRWLARLWAKWFGYFWAPCPICGENFAGFEWGASLLDVGQGCCSKPACLAAARERNKKIDFNASPYARKLTDDTPYDFGNNDSTRGK